MTYAIDIAPAGLRSLTRLPKDIRRRVDEKIRELAAHPRPSGVKKLHGNDDLFRIPVGDYRVLYVIDDQAHRIIIRKAGHRSEIYG